MSPHQWARIQELFNRALEQPANQRAAFLDQACGGDPTLKREVESLLSADASAGDFIEASLATFIRPRPARNH